MNADARILERIADVLGGLAEEVREAARSSKGSLALLAEHEQGRVVSPAREREAPVTPMSSSPTETPSALMTRSEVAALLRIDERTLGRWRNDAALKFPEPVHRARVLRWRRVSIERWIASRES